MDLKLSHFSRPVWLCLGLVVLLSAALPAADLYQVRLGSFQDAELLKGSGVEPILRDGNVFVVLADQPSAERLAGSALEVVHLAADIEKDRLALDRRSDRADAERYPVLFEKDQLRLLLVDATALQPSDQIPDLLPAARFAPVISYLPPWEGRQKPLMPLIGIDSLIARVRQDSVQSYLLRLQAFYRRISGTDSIYAARNWIKSKFEAFGYDSILFDHFTSDIGGNPTNCYNVVAVKPGTKYPQIEIVVGAHYDGVTVSPAVDDNGTGTAGVLEIARALANVPTDVTFKFVTFDAEEWGLFGSHHYADNAAGHLAKILMMFNMDMIGHYANINEAYVSYGASTQYAEVWVSLAQQWVGITGYYAGSSSNSDHYPFTQKGYDVAYIHEYYFSDVYHSPMDSLTYVSVSYATRMIKSALATVYTVSQDTDYDNDGIPNTSDNCLLTVNYGQADEDTDGIGTACDNCPSSYNPDQADFNYDGLGDACDGLVHIAPSLPPEGRLGIPYQFQMQGFGGLPPYHWRRFSGQIPYGLTLDASTGLISGTPNWIATYYFAIELKDASEPPLLDSAWYSIPITEGGGGYTCGDANADTKVNVSDAVYIINYVFVPGSPPPDPLEAGDVNCDAHDNVADAVYIINYVFVPGSPVPCAQCP